MKAVGRLAKTLAAFVTVTNVAVAQAGIDGSVPSPGGCDYPATGTFGASVRRIRFRLPVPARDQRHPGTPPLFGGGMWQVTGSVSFTPRSRRQCGRSGPCRGPTRHFLLGLPRSIHGGTTEPTRGMEKQNRAEPLQDDRAASGADTRR